MARWPYAAATLALAIAMAAQVAHAGDWREIIRGDGVSIGYNAQGVTRADDVLTVETVTALLPERQLPLYGLSDMIINCTTRDVTMGPFQFYYANGDQFGKPTEERPVGLFGDNEGIRALCANERPSQPGEESALAYFKATYGSVP